jgi:hypothetical protein
MVFRLRWREKREAGSDAEVGCHVIVLCFAWIHDDHGVAMCRRHGRKNCSHALPCIRGGACHLHIPATFPHAPTDLPTYLTNSRKPPHHPSRKFIVPPHVYVDTARSPSFPPPASFHHPPTGPCTSFQDRARGAQEKEKTTTMSAIRSDMTRNQEHACYVYWCYGVGWSCDSPKSASLLRVDVLCCCWLVDSSGVETAKGSCWGQGVSRVSAVM